MRNLASDWPPLDELQRRYLALALEKNHGNRQRTADMLGITRRTIQRLIARYNLNALNEAESGDGDDVFEE
jgi:DNA-binding NtrC family response regulator